MVRTVAQSPAVLGGYLQLSRCRRRVNPDPLVPGGFKGDLELASQHLRKTLAPSGRSEPAPPTRSPSQVHQGCELCLEAHENAARSLAVPEEEIAAARRSTSSEPRVAAIIAGAVKAYQEPTGITDTDAQELRDHGYSDREIADVAGVVALNILTEAFNLLAGLT